MKTSNLIAVLIGLFLFVVLFGSNFTVTIHAPDYATVYVDTDKKIYYAPPYIDNLKPADMPEPPIDIKKLEKSTYRDAKKLKYTPDQASLEKGCFEQKYRTLTALLLEKLHLVKPLPTRWNKDGSWNW
ncbi:MAG: hypothetical protein ACOY31_02570 [Bacillota bacterium]